MANERTGHAGTPGSHEPARQRRVNAAPVGQRTTRRRPRSPQGAPSPVTLQPWHLCGFALIAVLLMAVLALLAIAVPSIVDRFHRDLPIYTLTRPPTKGLDPSHARLDLEIIGLDEWAGTVTLRVSGIHTCPPGCTWTDRLTFVATEHNQPGLEGLSPAATLTLPPAQTIVADTVTLPIEGDPLNYPFDHYHMGLGILDEQVFPNGSVYVSSPEQARARLAITLHNRLPDSIMGSPVSLDPARFTIPDSTAHFALVVRLRFQRPAYEEILAVLLVLLVGATATYAVITRPLPELLINAGALILGIWGVRALLAGTTRPGPTGLDLALSLVILILLGGGTVRMLYDLHRRSGLAALLRRSRGKARATRAPGEHTSPEQAPRGTPH